MRFRVKGKRLTERFLRRHIKKHEEGYGMEQDQAVAVAYDEARKKDYDVPARQR